MFADKWREREWGDYGVGKTTKKKSETLKSKRARESNPSAKFDADFNEKANPAYEDVHTPLQQLAAQQDYEDEDKKKVLKTKLKDLVHKRSGLLSIEERPGVGESLQDFMKRRRLSNIEKSLLKSEKDQNDYDWILSGKRNFSPAQTEKLQHETDDFVTKTVTVAQPKEVWLKKHIKRSDGDGVEIDNKEEMEDEEKEKAALMVRVSKKEIHYMQKLTEKLYGKAVGEKEYVDEVARRVTQRVVQQEQHDWAEESTRGIGGLGTDLTADLSIVQGFGEEDGNSDIANGFHVEKNWKTAHDAQSHKNLIPSVHWERTLYGKQSTEECLNNIDAYQFITSAEKKGTLMNDFNARVPFECTAQSIIQSSVDDEQKRVFVSFRQWAERFEECDIVYYHSLSYTSSYRVLSSKTNTLETCKTKRLVIFHDLKNGFFVCNHFELVPKMVSEQVQSKTGGVALFSQDAAEGRTNGEKDHATQTEKHDYLWFGYCYLQYVV